MATDAEFDTFNRAYEVWMEARTRWDAMVKTMFAGERYDEAELRRATDELDVLHKAFIEAGVPITHWNPPRQR